MCDEGQARFPSPGCCKALNWKPSLEYIPGLEQETSQGIKAVCQIVLRHSTADRKQDRTGAVELGRAGVGDKWWHCACYKHQQRAEPHPAGSWGQQKGHGSLLSGLGQRRGARSRRGTHISHHHSAQRSSHHGSSIPACISVRPGQQPWNPPKWLWTHQNHISGATREETQTPLKAGLSLRFKD